MTRNKKVKIDYQRKANLIAKYEVYKAEHKKLPVSEEEYQDLKDELLILESRYPSIKKMAENLILNMPKTPNISTFSWRFKPSPNKFSKPKIFLEIYWILSVL